MNYEEQELRLKRQTFVISAALLILLFVLLSLVMGPVLALIWTSPILGALISYGLVRHWTGNVFWWMKKRVYAGTEGNYYTFDDLEMRVRCRAGLGEIVLDDVFRGLRIAQGEWPKRRRHLLLAYPEGIYQDTDGVWWFAEPALLEWLSRKGAKLDHQTLRLHRWLACETFPALRRKAELRRDVNPNDQVTDSSP